MLVDLPPSREDSGVRVRAKGETSLLVLMRVGGWGGLRVRVRITVVL